MSSPILIPDGWTRESLFVAVDQRAREAEQFGDAVIDARTLLAIRAVLAQLPETAEKGSEG